MHIMEDICMMSIPAIQLSSFVELLRPKKGEFHSALHKLLKTFPGTVSPFFVKTEHNYEHLTCI